MKKILEFSILSIFFFTPIESIPIINDFSVVKMASIIFFASCIFYPKYLFIYNNNFIRLIILYSLYCLLSVFWSVDKEATIFSVLGTVFPTSLLTILLLFTIKDKEMLHKVLKAYILGTAFLCLNAILDYNSIISAATFADQYRIRTLNQDENEMSFLINMGIVFTLYFAFHKKQRLLNYLIVFLFSFISLSTGSRTGFVVLTTIFLFWFISGTRNLYLKILLFGIFLTAITVSLPQEITSRLLETSNQMKSINMSGRGYIWNNAILAFDKQENYLFGIGWGSFRPFLKNTQGIYATSHNTYLTFLVELGFLGLFIFITFILYLWKKIVKLSKISFFYFSFFIPIILTMLTLGTSSRRWFFLLGVVIIKLAEFYKLKPKVNPNNFSVNTPHIV